jgi:hypothetical protein
MLDQKLWLTFSKRACYRAAGPGASAPKVLQLAKVVTIGWTSTIRGRLPSGTLNASLWNAYRLRKGCCHHPTGSTRKLNRTSMTALPAKCPCKAKHCGWKTISGVLSGYRNLARVGTLSATSGDIGEAGTTTPILYFSLLIQAPSRRLLHVEFVAHADVEVTRNHGDGFILRMIVSRDFVVRRHFQPNNIRLVR